MFEGHKNIEKYRVMELIGEGMFSKVFKAERLADGKVVAIKEIRKDISLKVTNKWM